MSSPESPASRPAVPEYGEYAEPGDPRLALSYLNAPPPTPIHREPRTRDRMASSVLLAIGFVWCVQVVLGTLRLAEGFQQMYAFYGGTGAYTPAGNLQLASAVIIASHVILFAATFLLTRARLKAERSAFWVPLVGGVIAATIYTITVSVLVFGDAALYSTMMEFMSR